MKWTHVVPGALLPQAQAGAIAQAIEAPQLHAVLGAAARGAQLGGDAGLDGGAHWSWLAQAFGLPARATVTAPYAWRALQEGQAAAQPAWIAHCDPVHILVGREQLRLLDLQDERLDEAESETLLALANEAAAASALGLRFARRGGLWFALAERPLDLHAAALDHVLGRAAQAHQPGGADARAWRRLANEIQMAWHASGVHAAREERGVRPANALWLHGGGAWAPLPARALQAVQVAGAAPDSALAAVLAGWQRAGAGQGGPDLAPWSLSVHAMLQGAAARREWAAWLAALPAWEQALQEDLARARAAGATCFELILCGASHWRCLRHEPAPAWWRRWSSGRAVDLAQLLAEPEGQAAPVAA